MIYECNIEIYIGLILHVNSSLKPVKCNRLMSKMAHQLLALNIWLWHFWYLMCSIRMRYIVYLFKRLQQPVLVWYISLYPSGIYLCLDIRRDHEDVSLSCSSVRSKEQECLPVKQMYPKLFYEIYNNVVKNHNVFNNPYLSY